MSEKAMAGYYKDEEELTKWESFKRFLWNSETGECIGRTGGSWAKIIIFYIIFFACLAAFWTVMLLIFYQTLDEYEPKWKLDGSLIGSNPGLGFRPLPPDSNIDSTLIWFNRGGDNANWAFWRTSLVDFLDSYKPGHQTGEYVTNCNVKPLPEKYVCSIDLTTIDNNCSEAKNFGYDIGQPCVLIKLNRVFGWRPVPYDNSSLPDNMPDSIKKNYNPESVWISCDGENAADRENIGPLNYYPSQQIPNHFFPFTNLPGYRSPFVFVHFEKPTTGVLINIECKAWAKNIFHNRMDREGSVHMELLID